MRFRALTSVALLAVTLPTAADAQCGIQKVFPDDPSTLAQFGTRVSVDGDRMVVASPGSPAAYVFDRVQGTWTQTARLEPSGPGGVDSVGLWGDTVILGSIADFTAGFHTGAAYVFEETGSGWVEAAKLVASDAAMNDEFGIAVDVVGTLAVVGSHRDDSIAVNTGSVYVFERLAGTWTQTQKLSPNGASAGANFGRAVSLAADAILVGAPNDGANDAGAVYAYQPGPGDFVFDQKITPADSSGGQSFGTSVQMRPVGNRAVVGAPGDSADTAFASGAAYLFDRTGGGWVEVVKLTPADPINFLQFGQSVAIAEDDDSLVLIGNAGTANDETFGAGDLFVEAGGWELFVSITTPEAEFDESFGAAVALTTDTAVIGAPTDDDNGNETGAVYAFNLAGGAPEPFCVGLANSAGPGAVMSSSGDPSVTAGTFTLEVDGGVPGQFGLFFYGPDVTAVAFGDGVRCVDGGAAGVFRLPALLVDGAGHGEQLLEFGSPPANAGLGQLSPFATWSFQFWYRDPAGGPAGFNLSQGLRVTFCP